MREVLIYLYEVSGNEAVVLAGLLEEWGFNPYG